mgnify:CR=1 FL=1
MFSLGESQYNHLGSAPFRVRPHESATKKRPAGASRFNMLGWAVRGSACCSGDRCGASRLARCAGKCLRISSAPRPDGFDPVRGQQKSDQPEPVALTCFGGPSGGRTLDLGIKSLERDVLTCPIAAKSQVVMFPLVLTALKQHCRTDIDGYPAMHKAPPRQYRGGARAYSLSIIT